MSSSEIWLGSSPVPAAPYRRPALPNQAHPEVGTVIPGVSSLTSSPALLPPRDCEPLLKPHVAVKKVPYVDEGGNLVTPPKPNGIKMEKFVFDVFQFARNFVAFEVPREEEFSPLKNGEAAGSDNPSTARRALLAQHYRWALQAGARFLDARGAPLPALPCSPPNGDPPAVCEISPLVSYSGEGLEMYLRGRELQCPFVLDEEQARALRLQET